MELYEILKVFGLFLLVIGGSCFVVLLAILLFAVIGAGINATMEAPFEDDEILHTPKQPGE